MREVDKYTITTPEVAKCPFTYYAAMRKEDPVHKDPGTGFYYVSDYKLVEKSALDFESLSSESELVVKKHYQPGAKALLDEAGIEPIDALLTGDPPEHDDYRRVGISLFNPVIVDEITPKIEKLVNQIIDNIEDLGQIEFREQFAARLPGTVIADEFGLPRQDQPRFKDWTDAFIASITPGISEEQEMENVKSFILMFSYLKTHLEKAAVETTGRVLHALATMNKKDGTPFSLMERCWMLLAMFVGGTETTMNLLTMGTKKLATDPELQEQLRQHPEKIEAFIEEMLRLEAPVQVLFRKATRDIEIGGTAIPKGATVILSVASANRDEKIWENPELLDLDRASQPRHMSFGKGRHLCVGFHLGRRELNIAFNLMLQRLDNIRLAIAEDEVEQMPLEFYRAIPSLPITFKKRS